MKPVWTPWVLVCLAGTLTGCLSSGSTAVLESIQRIASERSSVVLDEALVRSTNAGVLRVSLDHKPPVFFELASIHPSRYLLSFVSVDGAVIQLFNGQIRGTHRLGSDIVKVAALADDPFDQGFTQIHPSKRYYWQITAPEAGSNLVAQSRYQIIDQAPIQTLYGKWDTRLVEEKWSIDDLGYTATNYYWVDQNGLVVQSTQTPLPDSMTFHMRLESYQPQVDP